MTDNSSAKPVIVIDLAWDRIRIHKKTIHNLGNPEQIQLLINPDELIFAIRGCGKRAKSSHRIMLVENNSYELHSRSLIRSLQTVCPQWKIGEKYRIVGELITTENMACFNMKKSQPFAEMES